MREARGGVWAWGPERGGWARGRGAADGRARQYGQARRSQADGRETEERAAGARRRGVQRISYFLTDFAFI